MTASPLRSPALAVAITRGDQQRVSQLRDQIDALGGNREEPGT